MSKEQAMSMLTGQTITSVNPSLITGDMPTSPEVPQEVTQVQATKDIDSDRFAKIAAREAKFVKDREAFKLEQQTIAQEKEKLRSVKEQIDQFEQMKTKDPVAALKAIGFKEEDIFNFLAAKEEPTTEEKAALAAQTEIKKFRDEQLAEVKKLEQERSDRALKAYKDQIPKMISSEAEKYEYCNYNGPIAEEIIYETILNFMKDDQTLTPHDAMKEAIEAVEKMYEDEDVAMSKLKKRQPKEAVAPAAPEVPLKAQVNPRSSSPNRATSLTNKIAPTTASTAKKSESPSEKRARLESWLRNGKP